MVIIFMNSYSAGVRWPYSRMWFLTATLCAFSCFRTGVGSRTGVASCEGVDCSGHGTCVLAYGVPDHPVCLCHRGYVVRELTSCVPANQLCEGPSCEQACTPSVFGNGRYVSFEPGPRLSEARVDGAAVRLGNGSGWFLGGYRPYQNTSVIDGLAPTATSFSATNTPMIYPLSEHAAVYAPNRDWVVVIGADTDGPGWNQGVQLFDFGLGYWSTLPGLPTNGCRISA